MNYQTTIEVDGRLVQTLADIVPKQGPMKMLIVGKTPAPKSVAIGHYFQGRGGKIFWGQLQKWGILEVPEGCYEDEVLLKHNYGITDLVKVPHEFGHEPTREEYKRGIPRLLALISDLNPQVIFFVYKGVLDKILQLEFGRGKATYGFNPDLETLFQSKVFACPLPSVGGVTREEIDQAMHALQTELFPTQGIPT